MVGIMSNENWIGELPVRVRDAIMQRVKVLDVPAGVVVKQTGDAPSAMYQVQQGFLRLQGLHPDGNQVLILIYRSGNSFSESTLVARRQANHTTVALTDARISRLSSDDFWDLYHHHPEIPEALCRKFANNISRQFVAREIRRAHRLRKLIALMFENLADHCGQSSPGGAVSIPIPLTQTDIAAHYDVTRQSVQREVGMLKANGVLSKLNGIWQIADLEALRRI